MTAFDSAVCRLYNADLVMKRFRKVALLAFVLYAATILFASYHHHDANTEHLNCKLCQISSEFSDPVIQAKANIETHDFGRLPELELLKIRSGIATLSSGRAPPTISL
jgi:hypothetical protein